MSSSPHSPSSNGKPASEHVPSVRDLLYDEPGPQRASQLHELLQLLWGGKWIILGVLVLVVAATAAYTYSIPTTYRTSSLLLVDRESNSMLSSLNGRSTSPFAQDDRTLQNELLVLRQSRTIADRVAQRLIDLETHPETGASLAILHDETGTQLSQSQVARRVQNYISAQASGEQTDALYISSTSTDPHEAALVANLYAEEYITRTQEKSREDLKASRNFLEEQAATLKEEVQAAEDRIEEYMQQEEAIALDQETNRIVQRISEMEAERAQLRIELDMKQAALQSQEEELQQIEPKLAERLSSSLGERLSKLQAEKADLEARIDQIERENPNLEPGSGPYRDLQRMKEEAASLDARTDSLANRYVQDALQAGGVTAQSEDGANGVSYVASQRRELAQQRIEINGLQARIDALNERLRENRQSLQEIPNRSMELAQLQRERRSAEQIYSFVQEKLQEARLAEQSEMGYAEVIRPAGPGSPVSPDMRRNLMMALLLGLVLGGGLVVLRERLDTRIHQPGDLREHGHRMLGVVPSMEQLIQSEFDGQEHIEVDGQSVNTLLTMIVSPMSAAAEAYRRIRTNLRFTRPDGTVRSLVISSADKGDGKTTTCANLALALASAGQRTVVVDADLRRPWMHELLNEDREPGLSQIFYEGGLDVKRFSTNIENLSLIPAGEHVPNPAELLGSERMGRLVEGLEERFDYVLIDSPPVLLFSDVLGLAPRCDGTILVASSGVTDGRAFDHSAELLAEVDADLIGCVLNEFDASSSGLQSYGYNYGYAYSYRRLHDYYREEKRPAGVHRGLQSWWNGE